MKAGKHGWMEETVALLPAGERCGTAGWRGWFAESRASWGRACDYQCHHSNCVYTDSHHKQAPLWPRPSRVAHAYLNRQCTHLKKTTPISWQLFLHLHLSPSNYDSSQTGPNRRHGALGSRATGREWGVVMKKVPKMEMCRPDLELFCLLWRTGNTGIISIKSLWKLSENATNHLRFYCFWVS